MNFFKINISRKFLIPVSLVIFGMVSVCGMEPKKISDDEVMATIGEIATRAIEMVIEDGDKHTGPSGVWGTLQVCSKQIFGNTYRDLKPLIDFGFDRMWIAKEIYSIYNVPTHDLDRLLTIHQAIFCSENETRTVSDLIEQIKEHDRKLVKEEQAKQDNQTCREPIFLAYEFEEKVRPNLNFEQAINLIAGFDELIQKWIQIFQDLHANGIGISADIFAQQWEQKKLEILAYSIEYQQQREISEVMWDHIKDFLVVLVQPLHLSPVFFWF